MTFSRGPPQRLEGHQWFIRALEPHTLAALRSFTLQADGCAGHDVPRSCSAATVAGFEAPLMSTHSAALPHSKFMDTRLISTFARIVETLEELKGKGTLYPLGIKERIDIDAEECCVGQLRSDRNRTGQAGHGRITDNSDRLRHFTGVMLESVGVFLFTVLYQCSVIGLLTFAMV